MYLCIKSHIHITHYNASIVCSNRENSTTVVWLLP
uniref:Uncharacterized protein n=1 Tax=Anguilla anguilla TaxID=7936 RepID=A0A0E9VV37_ANGAN